MGSVAPPHAAPVAAPLPPHELVLRRRLRPVWEALAENAGLSAVVAFWAALVVAALPHEIVQDSWLALVSGREVVDHGLPHTDSLTVWTGGKTWIDQQWLGQAFYYGLAVVGGIRAVMLFHALVLVATVAAGLSAARRLGASATSSTVVGFATLLVAPWGMQMRTQDLGELFFVALVAVLALDARRPSPRVYLAVALLLVWANVHGSVLLGALLVLLRAATLVNGVHADRRRATLLAAAALAAPLASPYNLGLVRYYRHLVLNPPLHSFIVEWGPTTPGATTATFYLLAVVTIWAMARHGQAHTLFARLALLATLLAAVDSIRNIVWFGLCALVLLPRLLDPPLGNIRFRLLARLAPAAPAVAGATLLATGAFAATRPGGWLTRDWPLAQAERVATLAHGRAPRVLADDRYADWLLWTEPRLRGRVAYDVRFELLPMRTIRLLFDYRNRIGDDWRAAADGYAVIVLDPTLERPLQAGLTAGGRFRLVGSSPQIAILRRTGRRQPLSSPSSTSLSPTASVEAPPAGSSTTMRAPLAAAKRHGRSSRRIATTRSSRSQNTASIAKRMNSMWIDPAGRISRPSPAASERRPSNPRIRRNGVSAISQRAQTTSPSSLRRTAIRIPGPHSNG